MCPRIALCAPPIAAGPYLLTPWNNSRRRATAATAAALVAESLLDRALFADDDVASAPAVCPESPDRLSCKQQRWPAAVRDAPAAPVAQ